MADGPDENKIKEIMQALESICIDFDISKRETYLIFLVQVAQELSGHGHEKAADLLREAVNLISSLGSANGLNSAEKIKTKIESARLLLGKQTFDLYPPEAKLVLQQLELIRKLIMRLQELKKQEPYYSRRDKLILGVFAAAIEEATSLRNFFVKKKQYHLAQIAVKICQFIYDHKSMYLDFDMKILEEYLGEIERAIKG